MATYHVVLFVLVILHSYVQAGVLIDDFSLNRDVSISRLLNFSQVVDTPSDHSSFIGNQRTISMSKKEGSLGGSISIVLGYLAFSNDVRTQAIVDIDYRDISGDITPSLDFTENGADCFLVDVLASDQLHTISFIADTPEGPQTSEFSFSFGVEPPGTRLCLPYGGDLQAYDEVTSLHFSDEADSNGVDALYGFFCVAPSVSCWHEISPNGSEPILAGDTLSVTVHCENFVSLPPMNQPLDISVEFPPEIGTMDPSTFTCSTPDVPTITATPQRFLVSTDLLDNTTITCSFDIDLIAAGTVEGFAARVLNTRSGSVSFSNTGGNRADSVDFCTLGNLTSTIVVQPPPPTPPTTQAPTVPAPPTTQAPTTTAPTTAAPTTAMPTAPPTEPPTTTPPTTEAPVVPTAPVTPTTNPPTTEPPTTEPPTEPPTTQPPTTLPPTTNPPTTLPPTTSPPTTLSPTTNPPTTLPPTTLPPTTLPPTTLSPTTLPPTTQIPTTLPPTTSPPTTEPPTTQPPTTMAPTVPVPPTLPPPDECVGPLVHGKSSGFGVLSEIYQNLQDQAEDDCARCCDAIQFTGDPFVLDCTFENRGTAYTRKDFWSKQRKDVTAMCVCCCT